MLQIQKKIVKAGNFVDTDHVVDAIRNYKKGTLGSKFSTVRKRRFDECLVQC